MSGPPPPPALPVEHAVRPYEVGWTVEEVLQRSLFFPRHELRRLEQRRALRLNRRAARLRDVVQGGDVLRVGEGEEDNETGLDATPMELAVVHEDEAVLLIDKPPHLLVHPAEPGQRHTLVNGVAHHYQQRGLRLRVHPVHRLDRDTSGLVLLAKTPAAHRALDEQLRRRALKREYLAVVSGAVRADSGLVDAPIARNPTQPILRAVLPGGEPARTHYRVVERFADATLIRLELETGRTHQIRVHMSHLGHPLLGDRQYGRRGVKLVGRQALHAERMRFRHPATGEELCFEAPLPPDLAELLGRLREGEGVTG